MLYVHIQRRFGGFRVKAPTPRSATFFMRSFIFILFFTCSTNIFSQNIEKLLFEFNDQYYFKNTFEIEMNASVRFIFLPPNENSFAFGDFSIGIAYGIVPGICYIGITADVALGLDWFALFSNDNNNRRNDNRENYQLGASLGCRIFNLLQLGNFRIWSFFGSDFLYVILPMPYVGGELSFKLIGLEYAYFLPIYDDVPTRHRVSLKFHFPKIY
jgi:hypothetical protein